MEDYADKYTKDGTTDIHGRPVLKKETGNWRACPYILGTSLDLLEQCLWLASIHNLTCANTYPSK